MFDRLLSEARQDLAYRPRLLPRVSRLIWLSRRRPLRRPWVWRRSLPLLVVLLVSVLSADILVLIRMDSSERAPVATPQRPRNDFVASEQELRAEVPPVAPVAPVAPLNGLVKPHLFVVANEALPAETVARIRAIQGVAGVEVTDATKVEVDGRQVPTIGVEPSTFRAYTPKPVAESDELWANVASGAMVVSFELGNDGGLKLGSDVTSGGHPLRIGGYATVGMGSIAALVSRQTGRTLGLREGNGLVVSAPKVNSVQLRRTLLKLLPKGSQVATINPVLPKPQRRTVWPASAFMNPDQTRAALLAARDKLGRPYVWGAEGPDSFDCSGLVQWAYRQAGVIMPRVAAQQWASGPQIPLSQAQPGDLLFWRNDPTNPGYISHVAIYWGNDQMLHAPRTGDVVKIAKINLRNLAGVVRVSPGISARVR
ncbi:C40 family peptidase [Acrocarpospora catenulata]|uniref:C40 family peptidase n=1 Tax=Acrocarpospora catenulata TaxID=2836182 RepID=UPI0027E1FB23|nr:C40 family peptidase [Acrocarpospora catenulata]